LSIPENEIASLEALILRLQETPCLTQLDRFYKERERKQNYLVDIPKQIRLAQIERTSPKTKHQPRDKNHPVYGDTFYALGFQVNYLQGMLDDWFSWAHFVSPSASDRIRAILKRAKRKELRERFITAYEKHFSDVWKPSIDRPPSGDAMLDILQRRVPRLTISVTDISQGEDDRLNYFFEFHCEDCGGYIFTDVDERDDGPLICKACEQVFGSVGDMKALAKHIGNKRAIELGFRPAG